MPRAVADPPSFSSTNLNETDRVIQLVHGRWESRIQRRGQFERQWFTNIAQFISLQYHWYDPGTGTLKIAPTPSWRVRLVANKLLPYVRRSVAKYIRQKPQWVTIPASGDIEDQQVSMISTKVLRYYWRYRRLDNMVVEAANWLETCGNCFLRTFWDATEGPELQLEEDDLEHLPEEMRDLAQEARLGDQVFECVSPFEIDPDPTALRMSDVRELIHTRAFDRQELIDRYGSKAKEMTPDASDDANLTRFYERRIQDLGPPGARSVFSGTGSSESDERDNQVLVHQWWIEPSKKHPRGKFIVVAGKKIWQNDDLPTAHGHIPYSHLMSIPVPGRFWGTCGLEHSISLQAEYNRGRSQVLESRNLMSKPKWLRPKTANIAEVALTSEPGEVVDYTPPFKPELVQPVPLPEYVFRSSDQTIRDLEDLVAVHEVSQGKASSNIRSGVTVAALQEQDDQVMGPAFLSFESGLSQQGSFALADLSKNVTEERLITITGRDTEIDALAFTGRSLVGSNRDRPGVNYFDVQVQIGSQLPLNRLARADFIFNLADRQLIQDPQKLLQMLDLGTEEPIFNDQNLDRQNARRENLLLAQGMPVPVHDVDDHQIHLEEHFRNEKSPQWRRTAGPEAQEAARVHRLDHQLRLQALLQPQAPAPVQAEPGAEAELAEAPAALEEPLEAPVNDPMAELLAQGALTQEF